MEAILEKLRKSLFSPTDGPSTVNVCTGHQAELVCPFLNPANISHARSLKWQVRREGSSKHFQQLFHFKLKKTSNGTVFGKNLVPNATVLHEGVELGPNGSILIKHVRSVDEGDYECVVKTRHHHEPYKHLIQLKPIACKENTTLAPTPSISRPANIKTTAGRVAMTTTPTKGLNGSLETDGVTKNQNSTQEKQNPKIPGLSEAAPTSAGQSNQTRNGSQITVTLARFLPALRKTATIKSSTSTSTWTMVKPSLQTIKTSTRVTTLTTFSSADHGEGGAETKKDDFSKLITPIYTYIYI